MFKKLFPYGEMKQMKQGTLGQLFYPVCETFEMGKFLKAWSNSGLKTKQKQCIEIEFIK